MVVFSVHYRTVCGLTKTFHRFWLAFHKSTVVATLVMVWALSARIVDVNAALRAQLQNCQQPGWKDMEFYRDWVEP